MHKMAALGGLVATFILVVLKPRLVSSATTAFKS
jgi:hypothetical protein